MRTVSRWCRSCKALHEEDSWPPSCMLAPAKRSDLPSPMLIRDSIEPLQSMLDGKLYDSKSALRRTYRAAGVREMGNDKPKPFERPKADRKAIQKSAAKAVNRVYG